MEINWMNWELHGSFLAWAYDRLVVGGQLTTSDQPDRLFVAVLLFHDFSVWHFTLMWLLQKPATSEIDHFIVDFMRLRVYAKSEISKFKADNCGHHRGRINRRLMPLGDLIWRLSLQLVTVPSHCVQFSSTLDQTNCSFIFGMRARESQFDWRRGTTQAKVGMDLENTRFKFQLILLISVQTDKTNQKIDVCFWTCRRDRKHSEHLLKVQFEYIRGLILCRNR